MKFDFYVFTNPKGTGYMNDDLFPPPVKAVDHDLNLRLLEIILNKAPRLLREGLFLAAVPHEYDVAFLAALRLRDDGRDERLALRLVNYSFIRRLENGCYRMEVVERDFLQRRWLEDNPKSFRAAHERAVEFLIAHPETDPITHTHNLIFHLLISDANRGTELFIKTFQTYVNEHFLAPADRLIATATDAYPYITDESATHSRPSSDTLSGFWSSSNFDHLLLFCQARLSQLRGEWKKSYVTLSLLEGKKTLPKRLRPYVERAYGLALTHSGQYVEAMGLYNKAYQHFSELPNSEIEQGHTRMMLGDAYVDLGMAARGYRERLPATSFFESWQQSISYLSAFSPLPMMVYLAYHRLYFWHPRSWQVLLYQDWIIASLFAWGAGAYNEADKLLESLEDRHLEWNRADQKLAQLYLRLGDARKARHCFERLLEKEEGQYTTTLMQMGLANSYLQLGRLQQTEQLIEEILPIINQYEDPLLKAEAISLLAEAKLKQKHEDAIDYLGEALELYLQQEDLVAATEMTERLEGFVDDPAMTMTEQHTEIISQTANRLPFRQYQVRFQHPTLVSFRRLSLIFVGILIILLPALTIEINVVNFLQLNTDFAIQPPLRGDDVEIIAAPLFPTIARSSLESGVLLWQSLLILLVYAVIYLVLGLGLIWRTKLHSVQNAIKSNVLRINQDEITIGEEENARTIKWSDVTHWITFNVAWWRAPMPNHSATIIATENKFLAFTGATAWYEQITNRISGYMDEDAKHIDLSLSVFRSLLGGIYLLNLLFLLVFMVASFFSFRALLEYHWFGSVYRLIDLYPYFYVGLLVPLLWWVIGHQFVHRARLKLHLPFAWFVLGGGLLSFLLHLWGGFAVSNLPHIYLSLSSLLLFASALGAFWNAKQSTLPDIFRQELRQLFTSDPLPATAQKNSRLTSVRLASLAVLLVVLMLGLTADIVREVIGYHYLVVGAHKLAQVTQAKEEMTSAEQASALSPEQTGLVHEAIRAYTISLGAVDRHTAALTGRATANIQIERFEQALADYDERIKRQPNNSIAYSDRAIAYTIKRLSLNRRATALSNRRPVQSGAMIWRILAAERLTEQAEKDHQHALDDINKAIELSQLETQNSRLHSWRSVLHYSANQWQDALQDAEHALALDASNQQAYLNQGWASFQLGNESKKKAGYATTKAESKALRQEATMYYGEAIESFQKGQEEELLSADLKLAIGYAYYESDAYGSALQIWSEVIETNPDNWLAFILRGTAYWRSAIRQGNACDLSPNDPSSYAKKQTLITGITNAIEDFNAAIELRPEDAFSYRTRAQFHYLLRNCPGYNTEEQLRLAIDDYTLAIQYNPENDTYWQGRARLEVALGQILFNAGQESAAFALLEEATIDITEAYALQDSASNRRWLDFITQGVPGWYHLRRGDSYAQAREYEAALTDYEIAAQQIPFTNPTTAGDATEAAFGAGLMALRLNEIDRATEWYEEGIRRATEYNDTKAGKTYIQRAQGKLETFIGMYRPQGSAAMEIRAMLVEALDLIFAQTGWFSTLASQIS